MTVTGWVPTETSSDMEISKHDIYQGVAQDQQIGKREKSKWDPVSAEALSNPPGCSEDGMNL